MTVLDNQIRIVAGAGNHDDFEKLLALQEEHVADIRNRLTWPSDDVPPDAATELERRKGAVVILRQLVDRVRVARKNQSQQPVELDTENN